MSKSTRPEHEIAVFIQPQVGQIAAMIAEYAESPNAVLHVFKHGQSVTLCAGESGYIPGPDDGINDSHPCPGSPGCI